MSRVCCFIFHYHSLNTVWFVYFLFMMMMIMDYNDEWNGSQMKLANYKLN